MADKSTERAQQTTPQAADAARETAGKTTDTGRRASEPTSRSYEELLAIGRDNMEGMARASQAMLKGTSDLGSLWASLWERAADHRYGSDALTYPVRQLGRSAQSAERIHQVEPRPGLLAGPEECRGDDGDAHEQSRAPAGVRTQSRRAHTPAGGVAFRLTIPVEWRSGAPRRRGAAASVRPMAPCLLAIISGKLKSLRNHYDHSSFGHCDNRCGEIAIIHHQKYSLRVVVTGCRRSSG